MKWFWIGICILLAGSFGSNGHMDPYGDGDISMIPIGNGTKDSGRIELMVYVPTQEDYLRQAHQELVAAHGILKTKLTMAIKLLLQDAIGRSEPDPFDMGINYMDLGFYNETPIEAWRYYYRIMVDGEWKDVTKEEYDSKLNVAKKRNKQRISDMKSLLKELEK